MPKLLGMSYTQEGAGEDVLLLHGWGANKECFAGIIWHLKNRYRVTAVDFYGFGGSEEPATAYRVSDYANRLEFFCGLAGIKPFAVVGHSFGGRVAIRLLSSSPNFTKKLALVDSAGIKPRRGARYYGRVYLYKALRLLHPKKSEALRKKFGSSDYAALTPSMRETFKNVVNEDLAPYLAFIRAETLLIWGEKDTETPLYMAKKMNKKIAGSGLAIIPDAGHFSFIDRPHFFLKVLDRFLAEGASNAGSCRKQTEE